MAFDPQEREQERIKRHQERMARFQERMERHQERFQERIERRAMRWDHRRNRSGFGGIVAGSILLGIGVLFLLQNLGVLYFEDIWDFWPAILIVIGVARLSTSYGWGGRIWGAILTGLGSFFLLENLHLIPPHIIGRFWPLILMVVGVGLLVRNLERQYHRGPGGSSGGGPSGAGSSSSGSTGAAPMTAAMGSSSGSSDHPILSEWAVFGGVRRTVDSQQFEGGEINAMFGGVEVDLRKAATKNERMVIDINAIFGGVEIRVPETWDVKVTGMPIFGGYEDKTSHSRAVDGEKRPTLVLAGAAIFGGITVKN